MIKALAPVAQIARVYRLSEQVVWEMADLMGVDLTAPRDIKPVTEAGMQQTPHASRTSPEKSPDTFSVAGWLADAGGRVFEGRDAAV